MSMLKGRACKCLAIQNTKSWETETIGVYAPPPPPPITTKGTQCIDAFLVYTT